MLNRDTHKNNEADKEKHGILRSGEKVTHWAKLTDLKVVNILILTLEGIKKSVLVKKYGVNRKTIEDILNGINWKHISRNPKDWYILRVSLMKQETSNE